ncbi:MAG: hypothetical protein ACJA0I_001773 [Gammaproteobacteria bacterium]|jgi:hypothetical protein
MRTLKHPQYTYLKDGSYYFSRSVPFDLRHLYLKPRIIQALMTQSLTRAKLDDCWFVIELKQIEIQHLIF